MDERYHYFDYADKKIIIDLVNKTCVGMDKDKFDFRYLEEGDNALKSALETKYVSNEKSINAVYLMITKKCNLRCEFCSVRADYQKNSEQQEFEIREFQDKLIPYLQVINPRKIIITGGEPLMHKELTRMLQDIRTCLPDVYLILQTNGFLIRESKFVEKIAKTINHIEISSSHYKELAELKNIIEILRKYKVDIVISYTTDGNIESIKTILDFSVENRIGFMLNFVAPLGSAIDNNLNIIEYEKRVKIFEEIAKYILDKGYLDFGLINLFRQQVLVRRSCNALGKMLAIHPNGECYLCHSLCEEEFSVGNYKTNSIKDLINKWQSKVRESEILELFNVDYKEHCKECKLRYLCGGMCAAYIQNKQNTGDLCKLQKFFLSYNLLVDDESRTEEENLRNFIKMCENKEKILEL